MNDLLSAPQTGSTKPNHLTPVMKVFALLKDQSDQFCRSKGLNPPATGQLVTALNLDSSISTDKDMESLALMPIDQEPKMRCKH